MSSERKARRDTTHDMLRKAEIDTLLKHAFNSDKL